ncbi:MAG: hypothetical protein K6C32_00395 [Bacilli bacterium]|nr:hypothetical protein [Bacilli bacterium]
MTFIEHLKKYLNEEEIEKLVCSLELESKHALLLNTQKMSAEKLLSIYPHLERHPIVENAYLYNKSEYELGKSLLYELGVFYLQEPSAMLVSCLLNPKPNQLVLDLCGAPGGKTVGASLLMKQTGLVVSNDLSNQRAQIIKENAERMGLCNLLIVSNDFSKIYKQYLNTFDAIILDAPCSGSGMFRKNDLMKQDWNINKVLKYASIQKELILMCYQMLKEGGKLIYSTCSFSYEEDEEIIEHLLRETDAEIEPIENNPLFYVSRRGLGIHLFPYLFPGEGHYIALIKKPGILKSRDEAKQVKKKYGPFTFLSQSSINMKNLNIIRDGVKLGEELHDDIKYDIHYARYINSFSQELEIDEKEAAAYLEGNSINKDGYKGYILLKYQGVPIDLAKGDGRIVKNRYPKYMRKKIPL